MLVCPQCQFENPSHHKFCQKCGYSLTQKSCDECGATVVLNTLDCPDCGARTGTVWLAVISRTVKPENDLLTDTEANSSSGELAQLDGAIAQASTVFETESDQIQAIAEVALELDHTPSEADNSLEDDDINNSEEEVWLSAAFDASNIPQADALQSEGSELSSELESEGFLDLSLEAGTFLDDDQRYQLIESLTSLKPGERVLAEVLDTQPLQMSPLQAAQPTLISSSEQMNTFVIAAAQVYLLLKSQFPAHFPTLQDAWESDLYQVILLENYSHFPQLMDHFSDSQITPQHILSYFQQMADLWVGLERYHCRQSLLEFTNLRVDPTAPQTLCLPRLYSDAEDSTVSLSRLGTVWKHLVQQSQRTLFGSLTQLLRDLNEGQIETMTQLQEQLAEIDHELNFSSPPTEFVPPSAPTQIQFDDNEDTDVTDTPMEGNKAPTIPRMTQLFHLEAVGATDIGRKRQRNEDSFGLQTILHEQQTPQGRILDAQGLYILCDGMGGHSGGEVASQLAIDTLKQYFQTQWTGEPPTPEIIHDAILQANNTIYQANQQAVRSGVGRMGTTLVMAMVTNNRVEIAHVGDSRLYRLTSKGIEQMTLDHEVGQREIQRGIPPEVAYARPDAYQLTQALGPRDRTFVKPDIQSLEIQEDTMLILASDGLTDNDLLEIYQTTHLSPLLDSQTDLKAGVNRLIDLANEHNGHDNITIIAIRMFVSESSESEI